MATCIEVESYGHPGSHPPAIITQDADNKFVTDIQIAGWEAKVDQADYDVHIHSTLSNPADTVVGLTVSAAGSVSLLNGVAINEFSTDIALSGESDEVVPTERAVKQYVDNKEAAFVGYRLKTPDNSQMSAFVIDVAGQASFPTGVGINRFSSDVLLASDSDSYVPTERAVKTYADVIDAKVTVLEGQTLDTRVTAVEEQIALGIVSQTLTFGGGTSGEVATMTITDGLVTGVTLVA